jgi:hypothetical protein
MRSRCVLPLMLACLAVASGCGGEDEDPASSEPAPTKAEFVEQANQICEESQTGVETASKELGQDATEEEVEELLTETFVPSVREQVSDIRDLGFPEGDEEELGAILDETEAVLDTIEDDPAAAIAGDDPFKEVNPKLEAYGLEACV